MRNMTGLSQQTGDYLVLQSRWPGNHFTEPLGPDEKGHAHTASVSGFGAGISMPGLEDRQSEQVILQKGEKKATQPGKFLQHFQECLMPGRHF